MIDALHQANLRDSGLHSAHHLMVTARLLCHAAAQQTAQPSADAAQPAADGTADGGIDGHSPSPDAEADNAAAQPARTTDGSADVLPVQPAALHIADAEPSMTGAAENGQQQTPNGGPHSGAQPPADGRPASRGPRMSRTLELEPIADKARCARIGIWHNQHWILHICRHTTMAGSA